MRADLHIHTVYSDGALTPRQVAERARAAGLALFAITDHDECRGFGEIADVAGAIAGIEVAAEYEGEVHVLGLRIDWRSARMLAHVRRAAAMREARAEQMVARLQNGGINITMEDVREECVGGVIGRPHMAAALVKKGYAPSVQDAFESYLARGTPYYVPQRRITVAEAAALIRDAGGLPVLAHPGLLTESQRKALLPRLVGMGFWGVEAYHPVHTDGQCKAYESAAREQGLFVTAGSDYHSAASSTKAGIGEEVRGGAYLHESLQALQK